MRPYKPLFEAWNDYLPPITQIAGKEDIDKWSDDKAEREIERLRSFIARIRTTGDDSSVQDEVRRSYDAINRIERIKFPDKYAKKQASKDKARVKGFKKRRNDRETKISNETNAFNSASNKDQAEFVMWNILNRISSTQRHILDMRKGRYGNKDVLTSLIKKYRKEESQAVEFKNKFKLLFPNIEGKNKFKKLSMDDTVDQIKDSKLKDFTKEYLKWVSERKR